jgi:hypothetical protein
MSNPIETKTLMSLVEAANSIDEADKASRTGAKAKVGAGAKVAMGRTYYVAFVLQSSGKWDIVKSFTAPNDDAANAYAERNYPNADWYVIDANHNHINA